MSIRDAFRGTVRPDELAGHYSPRTTSLDLDHAKRLAEVYTDLPPVLVHRDTMRIVDGVHRAHAAKHHLGLAEIEVAWFAGTENEARDKAVSLNTEHGLPLPLADRRHAAKRMIERHPDWSDPKIAEFCGLASNTISALREAPTEDRPTSHFAKSDTRQGRDGIHRPARQGAATERARDYLDEHPGAPVREVARETGVSPDTASRVKRTPAPAPERPSLAPVPDAPAEPRVDEALTFIPRWTKDSRFLRDARTGAFGRWMHKRTLPHPNSGANVDYATWLEDVDLDACPAEDRDLAAAELRRIAAYYLKAAAELSGTSTLRSTS